MIKHFYSKKQIIILICGLLKIYVGFSQSVIFVTENGNGIKNGSSWDNAIDKIQLPTAIEQASTNTEFWVKVGLYKTTQSTDRHKSIVIEKGIKIYGGFIGNETSTIERDTSLYSTFSGDLLNNDLSTAFYYNESTKSDNTYHIFTINTSEAIAFDNIEVLSSNANGSISNNTDSGGGIYFTKDTINISINHCNFFKNSAYNYGVIWGDIGKNIKLSVINSKFINNQAGSVSAIYLGLAKSNNQLNIFKSTFQNNFSDGGQSSVIKIESKQNKSIFVASILKNYFLENGASVAINFSNMRFSDSCYAEMDISHNVFKKNNVPNIFGTGVIDVTGNCKIKIQSSDFEENDSNISLELTDSSKANISNCYFTKSKLANIYLLTPYASRVRTHNVSFSLIKCKIINNKKGVYIDDKHNHNSGTYYKDIKIVNSLISDNYSMDRGGGIYVACRWDSFVNLEVVNCTITKNYAYVYGGGISAFRPNFQNNNVLISFKNTILFDNSCGYYSTNRNYYFDSPYVVSVSASNSLISGGFAGTSILSTDPNFVNPSNKDYHLSSTSNCINSGNNLFSQEFIEDLDNNSRQIDIVDIGCYEYGNCPVYYQTTQDFNSGQTIKIESGGVINSNNKITQQSNVTFDAKKSIILQSGFEVNNGGVFKTQLDGCGNN